MESEPDEAPGAAASAAFAGSPARAALLERGRELAALRTIIGEAVGGRSRVVVVEGEGGIGKTRLLAEARGLVADAGLRLLAARGGELEREFAFGVVRQLFEPESFGSRFAGLVSPVDTPWRVPTAVALSRVGRVDEAHALATHELEQARRWGAPGTVARALRLLGILEQEDGLERLRRAGDLAARSPARLEQAKTLAALGAALRRARRPTDAREPLRQALALADVLGAQGLAGYARSELYAAGGRPRTPALVGVDSLTPSERRVAALAAEGQTNREIAQGLFVTPKTIELHLGNAYRKLGVRSRRELPAELLGP